MGHKQKSSVAAKLRNKAALLAFDILAAAKGYKFIRATEKKAIDDAAIIYNEDGFSFPKHLIDEIQRYRTGAVSFVAYHRGIPAGLVRLGDPRIVNRPYELYGVDKEGLHHEIQSLAVRKGFRDGTQFVLLGMVKKLYEYSTAEGIASWSACGAHSVYLSMRRYCRKTEAIPIDFKNIEHPLTSYLFTSKIIETYFTMDVSAFDPWDILVRCVKKMARRVEISGYIKEKIYRSGPFSLALGLLKR